MVNYQNSKIYMIESLEGDCKYYGSTTQTLAQRLTQHKSKVKSGKNIKSKEILKYNDAKILLVELYPCNSKTELEAKEAEYIRHNYCVNKCIPQRTQKEYREDNKEQICIVKKICYNNKKDKYKKMSCDYYEKNKEYINKKCLCDCGKEYSYIHYKRHEKSQQHQFWQKIYDFIYE